MPLSDNNEVVLLADGRVACVTESYDDRVHCVDLEGVVVGSFGREGQGPGEFGSAASLVRGDRRTVGVGRPVPAAGRRVSRLSPWKGASSHANAPPTPRG